MRHMKPQKEDGSTFEFVEEGDQKFLVCKLPLALDQTPTGMTAGVFATGGMREQKVVFGNESKSAVLSMSAAIYY